MSKRWKAVTKVLKDSEKEGLKRRALQKYKGAKCRSPWACWCLFHFSFNYSFMVQMVQKLKISTNGAMTQFHYILLLWQCIQVWWAHPSGQASTKLKKRRIGMPWPGQRNCLWNDFYVLYSNVLCRNKCVLHSDFDWYNLGNWDNYSGCYAQILRNWNGFWVGI